MKATTVKEVLVAMRWIIDNVGWCQGALYTDKSGDKHNIIPPYDTVLKDDISGVCLSGAWYLVECDNEKVKDNALNILNSLTSYGMIVYNDSFCRTKEQVLALLDKAIKQAT
jgi:hypothetical protein